MPTDVFGYLRVSGKAQVEGDGFPRQVLAIEYYANANDMKVVRWYEEKATPGKTEWEDRPTWAEMALSLTEGSVILIESLNRLARDLMVQEHIIADLRKRHVTLISTAEPDLCVDDPSRKLLRQIMGAISEYDRTMLVLKMAGAKKRIRIATGKCEGRKLYGQHPNHPNEVVVIARIVDMRVSGQNWTQIATKLNSDGVPTRTRGKWHAASVQRIGERI